MSKQHTTRIALVLTAIAVVAINRYTTATPTQVGLTDEDIQTLDLRHIVKGGAQGILVEHKGYTLSYSTTHNTPYYVAWQLTQQECQVSAANRKNYSFIPDEDLPYTNQVTSADYTNSGYDRGHMCPAADMKWDADAMHDCFYMSNICPQVPILNQQYWERLERVCRRWAEREGSVYIVCGPVYNRLKPQRIGREHMIAVPDAFFKVIITLAPGREKGIGFYYANDEAKQTMESASRTIDGIEQITGYDFFSELPDQLEDKIESSCKLHDWN